MHRLLFVLALSMAGSALAQAEAQCDDQALASTRREFKKLFDQKKYAAAVKLLSAKLGDCYEQTPENEAQFCWAQSDLALGLLKSGDANACRNQLASLVVPNVTCRCCLDEGEETPAKKAALYNYERCGEALANELKPFTATACPLKLPPRTLASALLPPTPSAKPQTECLALVGTAYGADFSWSSVPRLEEKFDKDPSIICNKLVRVTGTTTPNATQTTPLKLPEDDVVLGDSTFCCALDRLGVSTDGGTVLVHISSSSGPTQPCGGSGTMRATAEGIYQLEKNKLTLKKNLSWGVH